MPLGGLSTNPPPAPLPYAGSSPMHPACPSAIPPAPSIRGHLPAAPHLRRGTMGTRARTHHLLPAHYNLPLGPRHCQLGFFKRLAWEPSAKNSFQAA